MRPVSARFLRAITGSHTAAFRARVVAPGQTGVNPTGTEVPIFGGNVIVDGTADIRSTLQLEVDGSGMWPQAADSLLTPYGNELFVERGIKFGGGSVEWVSLGYHRIDEVEQDEAPSGPIRIAAPDRMSMIVDSKLESPRQFAATAQHQTIVSSLVGDAYGAVVIEWDDADVATDAIGRTVNVDSDRYAFLRELLTGLGKTFYFDYRGILVIKSPPETSEPVWVVSRGKSGVLVTAGRSLSREGVRNAILATGEALDTAPPARGLAYDNDPASPTLYGGPFGKILGEYSSPLMTTDAQCRLAAATVLRRSLGLPYNVDFSMIPNPALEPDDPVAIGLAGDARINRPRQLTGDSFERSVADDAGFGTSENGDAWTGTTSFGVGQGTGRIGIASLNLAYLITNSTLRGRVDSEQQFDTTVPVAAAGAALPIGTVSRRVGTSGEYITSRLEFNVGGTCTLKIARHSDIYGYDELVALVDYDTYTAGSWWRVKTRQLDDELMIKAWCLDTDVEPRDWQLTATDTTVRGVRSGLFAWRLGTNTNAVLPQWRVDNWRTFTVVREAVTGGEVHVIDTLNIPLTASGAMSATTRQQSLVPIATA